MRKVATILGLACCFLTVAGLAWANGEQAGRISQELQAEVGKQDVGPEGRALPMASHWTTGTHPASKGWAPDHQLVLIDQGHYLLPWFQLPGEGKRTTDKQFQQYYQAAFERVSQLKLPITLVASQWEQVLASDAYRDLPLAQNPNVVNAKGEVLRRLSPFGPIEAWRELGSRLTRGARLKQLQAWYPDPPKVIFLSNNEQSKLAWADAETDVRFVQKYGTGQSADFKRAAVANGWIERYGALLSAMREGLDSPAWRSRAVFAGYDAFGPPHFGRWDGWRHYSLYIPGRMDPDPMMWGGASAPFYTNGWEPSTDFTTWSPQIQAMNQVFQLNEAYRDNPQFWFELSVWDGFQPNDPSRDKRHYYSKLGQRYTPQRYAGAVQFGMWLLRPRVVREYRDWTYPWEDGAPYFMAVTAAVDRVHTTPLLRDFWRQGELVPNRQHKHPYQRQIPAEYADKDRWFLLDADVNPGSQPWSLSTQIPVYALALVRKAAPQREWLIYAHAPLGDLSNVGLTLPGYGQVRADVAVAGSFYIVSEERRTVERIETGSVPRPPTFIKSS